MTLLEHIKSLEPIPEEQWQWSNRSSMTNCIHHLLKMAPHKERHAIIADLAELERN